MIVFDLDGTLRDVTCADHLIPKDSSRCENWQDWQNHVNANGSRIQAFAYLFNYLTAHRVTVVIVTSSLFGTREWCERNLTHMPSEIVERGLDDHRHPHDYKKAFIDGNSGIIDLWVDDDETMCDYVESMGIPVCRAGRLTHE